MERVLLLLAVFVAAVHAQVDIGTLPTIAHNVSGTFSIVDNQTAQISNFNYDGQGTGVYLYFYMEQYRERGPTPEGRGVKIPFNDTENQVPAMVFSNQMVTINLPENWYMCDFSWFTIWSEDDMEFYTRIQIPAATFVETEDEVAAGTSVWCTDTRARRWISVGTLPNLAHGVSGELHIINSRDAVITNFNYDGRGPGAYLYFYGTEYAPRDPDEHGGGQKMPVYGGNEDGSFLHAGTEGSDTSYTNATFYIYLPDNWYMCDFSWFTIWCEKFWQLFTNIEIPSSLFVEPGTDPTLGETVQCMNPKDRRWQRVGSLPNLAHGVSGDLWLINNRSAAIMNFDYDGQGPAAFQYFYEHTFTAVDMYGGGVKIPVATIYTNDESGAFQLGMDFTNDTLYIYMPNQWNFCDFAFFTIWCEDFNQSFTEIGLPLDTWVTTESYYDPGTNLFCYPQSAVSFESDNPQFLMYETPRPRLWVYVGSMPTQAHGVSGDLWIADRKTLIITDFNYDGLGPAAYLYFYDTTFGEPNMYGGGVKIDVSPSQGPFPVGTSYEKNVFVIHLPDEQEDDYDVCDFAWFTIWCEDFNQTFTQVEIPRNLFVGNMEDMELGVNIVCDVPDDGTGSGLSVVASLISVAILALLATISG